MQGPSQCPPISTPSLGSLRVGGWGPTRSWDLWECLFWATSKLKLTPSPNLSGTPGLFCQTVLSEQTVERKG